MLYLPKFRYFYLTRVEIYHIRVPAYDSLFPIKAPQIPGYRVGDEFFTVEQSIGSASRVNTALYDAWVHDEMSFVKTETLPTLPLATAGYGLLNTKPESRLIPVSTVVASALVSTTELYPGGTSVSQWTSFTVEFPSGAIMSLQELFSKPYAGLTVLILADRRYFLCQRTVAIPDRQRT